MCNKSKHIELFWLHTRALLGQCIIKYILQLKVECMCVFIFVSFEKKKSVHDRMINRSELAIITHQAWSMYERTARIFPVFLYII